MDPNACLERLITALAAHDDREAQEALADLHHWVNVHGGALPREYAKKLLRG